MRGNRHSKCKLRFRDMYFGKVENTEFDGWTTGTATQFHVVPINTVLLVSEAQRDRCATLHWRLLSNVNEDRAYGASPWGNPSSLFSAVSDAVSDDRESVLKRLLSIKENPTKATAVPIALTN